MKYHHAKHHARGIYIANITHKFENGLLIFKQIVVLFM